jgi:uncharacterized protein
MSRRSKYAGYEALEPFFEIILEGLSGFVDGEHFFDAFAEDARFESLYDFPGWPMMIRGRAALVDALSGYGKNIKLESSDGLVVHRTQNPRVVILEYAVHGKIVATGAPYDNPRRQERQHVPRPDGLLHGHHRVRRAQDPRGGSTRQ